MTAIRPRCSSPRGAGVRRSCGGWLITAAVAGLLAGCAGQTKIYDAQVHLIYNPTEFGYGAGRRDLTTVIRGNPFELDQERFEAVFLDRLNRSSNLLQPTHFTTTPGESARPAYRAVFLFDAGPALLSRTCSQPLGVPVVELEGKLRLVAAFCRNQGIMTTVTGEVEGLDDPDDPRFAQLINQMVTLLFPPIDPTRTKGNPWPWLIVSGPAAAVDQQRLGRLTPIAAPASG